MKAYGENIIVSYKKSKQTEAGLFVPNELKREEDSYAEATVLSVGSKIEDVKEGDVVIFVEGNILALEIIEKDTFTDYRLVLKPYMILATK